MRQREVAGEATLTGVERIQIGENEAPDGGVAKEGARSDRWSRGGSAGLDPVAQHGQVFAAGTRLLLRRRHFSLFDALEQFGLGWLSRDDLAASNEAVAVKDVGESALGGALAAVTAVTVVCQNRLRPRGQCDLARKTGTGDENQNNGGGING